MQAVHVYTAKLMCIWGVFGLDSPKLNLAATFPDIPDADVISSNSFLIWFLDGRGGTTRICCTLLYKHRGTTAQDNPICFPTFLLTYSPSKGSRGIESLYLLGALSTAKYSEGIKTKRVSVCVFCRLFPPPESRIQATCPMQACMCACVLIYVPL